MAKQKGFQDPFDGIDPVMEGAFSTAEVDAPTAAKRRARPAAAKVAKSSPSVARVEFPDFDDEEPEVEAVSRDASLFSGIPVEVSVELGRTKISLKDVYELGEGSIVELDRLVGEPLDLTVNGQLIAHGEVVAIDNNYGIRVTSIVAKNQPAV
jgi:flagellar motor switch protein FliN/FliY